MKQLSTSFKVALIIFFLQNLSAQVPKDFEFLDHRARITAHMDSKIFDDKLVSVQNVSIWPMVSVTVADMNTYELDTILGTYWSQSDLMEFSDGTFDIYLHSMFDYDICVSGFIHIAYDGSSFSADTLHSYILTDPIINYDTYPTTVIKNKAGGYYLMDYDSLYVSDKVSLTGLRSAAQNGRLFQNDALDAYLYRGNHIVKILDNGFDTIQTTTESIKEIKNNGQFNDVLTDLNVQRWNDDFSQRLQTWPLPEKLDISSSYHIESFYQLHIGDFLVTYLSVAEENYKYSTVSETGIETILESGIIENEEAVGFHFLSENNRVAIHNYELPEIESNQLLYRHVDITEEIEYDRRQVSLDSLSFEFLDRDTIDVFVTSAGDTVYWLDQSFEVGFQYTNNSNTNIRHVNVISSEVLSNFYFPDIALNYTFNNLIQISESSVIDTSYYTQYGIPDIVTMAIPGTDFRINDDPNRVITTDVVLDVSKVIFDKDIKLFPNPTGDILNIETENKIIELAIYNAQGQLVMLKSGHVNLSTINVQDLNAGIYFIKLRMDTHNTYGIQQFVKL